MCVLCVWVYRESHISKLMLMISIFSEGSFNFSVVNILHNIHVLFTETREECQKLDEKFLTCVSVIRGKNLCVIVSPGLR